VRNSARRRGNIPVVIITSLNYPPLGKIGREAGQFPSFAAAIPSTPIGNHLSYSFPAHSFTQINGQMREHRKNRQQKSTQSYIQAHRTPLILHPGKSPCLAGLFMKDYGKAVWIGADTRLATEAAAGVLGVRRSDRGNKTQQACLLAPPQKNLMNNPGQFIRAGWHPAF
jgi:hypothetical protein